MRCEGIQDRFSAYLEDELEAAERRSIESHVEACVGCRQELALLRRTVSTLQSLEEIEVPPRLTAAIQAGVSAEGGSRWRHLVSRLFFPLHIKLPLEAMALLLVTLGAVYVYRSAPELAQAPRPQAVTERESRDKTTPIARGQRGDWQEQAARKRPAEKLRAHSKVEDEQKALGEADAVGRALRKGAPSASLEDVSPMPEMILKTKNPSQAASRVAHIVKRLGGKLLEKKGEHQLILTIPASAYPEFLAALGELGEPMHPPAEISAKPSPEGAITFSFRLIP
ncbi:MAG: DUF2275 domain-containing protein [candidate division NC10 bacterium]